MAAKTLRNLTSGGGTVDTVSGSNKLSFSAAQQFKHGATIQLSGGQLFTIQEGQGTSWTAKQKATATVSGSSFNTSDSGTGRGRGSSGVIVPWAVHTIYCSFVDDAGNFDYYSYVDTLTPEGGLHAYTKDPVVGAFYATMAGDTPSMLTPDRIRMLEGIVRGGSGKTFSNPDARLDNIENRLNPAVLAGTGQPSTSINHFFAASGARDAGLTSDNAGNRTVLPSAGTLRNLRIQADVAPGAAKSWIVTVEKNGSDSTLTAQLSGASQTTASDLSHTVSVAAGDAISIKVAPAGTPAAARIGWSMELVASDAGDGGAVDTLLSRGDA
jgi:hypothetical protein